MANKHRGEYTLVAGPSRYVLRLTTAACCELEDLAGLPFDEIQDRAVTGSLLNIRRLLWAALQDRYASIATADPDGFRQAGTIVEDTGGLRRFLPHLKAFLDLNRDEGNVPTAKEKKKTRAVTRVAWDWSQLAFDVLVAGFTLDQFWSLSLRELWQVRRAVERRQRDQHERDTALAWQIERISMLTVQQNGMRILPSLSEILGIRQGPRQQSPDEQRFVLETLSANLGVGVQRLVRKADGSGWEKVH